MAPGVWRSRRCLLMWLLSLVLLPAAAEGLLDGKSFIGLNGVKGKPLNQNETEELIFEQGVFRARSCEPLNFPPSRYGAHRVGDTIHFDVTSESPTHGRIEWRGVVQGRELQAQFIWTRESWYGEMERAYQFRGELKP